MNEKEITQDTLKLSAQAVGAVMMAVQKGLLAAATEDATEDCDITQLIMDFDLEPSADGLVVTNPPSVKLDI